MLCTVLICTFFAALFTDPVFSNPVIIKSPSEKYLENRISLQGLLYFVRRGESHLLIFRIGATYPGIGQGLSNNSVRCIYQAQNGCMWFGIYDGLNCYDGYDFKIFRNKLNDTSSLLHKYINS